MNNINNKLITKKDVETILNSHLKEEKTIKNIELYQNAFVHKSFLIYNSKDEEEDLCCVFDINFKASNERLEFFGDSCLNLITAEYLFDKYPFKNEGFLTKLRTRLVRNTQLSYLGTQLGFKKWLLISSHIEKISGRDNPRLIEDVFESFIACVYKDLGFYTCKEFIFSVFDKYVNLDEIIANNDNYKDILLRFFQTNTWKHPVYCTIKEDGDVYNKKFVTCVLLDKKSLSAENKLYSKIIQNDKIMKKEFDIKDDKHYYICHCEGKTKKESEQNSSKKCLELFNVSFDF
jgi:ribonuclease-3